jgi:hypothetical protein
MQLFKANNNLLLKALLTANLLYYILQKLAVTKAFYLFYLSAALNLISKLL